MATVVCRGLQPCLESQVLEPRTLRLRLSSPKPHFPQPLELTFKSCFLDSNTKQVEEKCHSQENSEETNDISSNADLGGWSFLQAISNGSPIVSSKETIEKEKTTYVHPLVKRSMSTLSEKSLELCTESLGSETGTDIIEDNLFSLSSSGGNSNPPTREQQKPRQLLGAEKASSRSFPPPLTTISGLESLQVRPHREDGRLIIKATKAPPRHSLFQAERSHGRLRLSFVTPFFDSGDVATDASNSTEESYNEEDIENDYLDEEEDEEERELDLEVQEDEEQEDDEENDAYLEEDVNGNSLDVGVKMGMKNFQRPGRCKEGEPESKGLLNWESFWVATS